MTRREDEIGGLRVDGEGHRAIGMGGRGGSSSNEICDESEKSEQKHSLELNVKTHQT